MKNHWIRNVFIYGASIIAVSGCSMAKPTVDEEDKLPLDADLVRNVRAFQPVAVERIKTRIDELRRTRTAIIAGKAHPKLQALLGEWAEREKITIDEYLNNEIDRMSRQLREIEKGESWDLPSWYPLPDAENLHVGDFGEFRVNVQITRRDSDNEFFGLSSLQDYRPKPAYFVGWDSATLERRWQDVYEVSGAAVVTGYKTLNVKGESVRVPILQRFSRRRLEKVLRGDE